MKDVEILTGLAVFIVVSVAMLIAIYRDYMGKSKWAHNLQGETEMSKTDNQSEHAEDIVDYSEYHNENQNSDCEQEYYCGLCGKMMPLSHFPH